MPTTTVLGIGTALTTEAIQTQIAELPFTVVVEPTLEAAQQRLRRQSFAAILLSLDLPRASQLEALAHLCQIGVDLPIIVVGQAIEDDWAIHLLNAGAEDVWDAAVDRQTGGYGLNRLVQHAIARYQSRRQPQQSPNRSQPQAPTLTPASPINYQQTSPSPVTPTSPQTSAPSESDLQTILTDIPNGVLWLDKDGQIQWVNQAATDLFQCDRTSLVGQTFGMPIPGQITEVCLVEPTSHIPLMVQVEMQLVQIEWHNQPVCLVLLHDVTTQRQAEAIVHQQVVYDRLSSISHIIRHSLDLQRILDTTSRELLDFLQADRVLIGRIHLAPDDQGEADCDARQDGRIERAATTGNPDQASERDGGNTSDGNTSSLLSEPNRDFPTAPFPQPHLQVISEALASSWSSLLHQTLPALYDDLKRYTIHHQRQIQVLRNRQSPMLTSSDQEALQAMQVQASLATPLFQDDQIWAVLIVQQCKTPRYWKIHEMDFLCRLANQLESSVYQASLYNQLQELNADLGQQVETRTAELERAFQFEATLQRILEKVRDSLDEEQILHTAVRELVQAVDAKGCNAGLYDTKKRRSTIRYEYAAPNVSYVGRVLQLDAFPEIYGQLMNGDTFQFCSLLPNASRGRTSVLTSPIYDDQGSIGDLWLIHDAEHAFGDQPIRLVKQIASQCAIAIRQARLYQESQAQVRELDKLNRLKDDFISTVSHELRTPIASIRMAAHMLQVRIQAAGEVAQDKAIAQYLQVLQDECQREIRLINDLLDLSRLEAGQETLQCIPVDLKIWLPRITESFREQAKSRQHVFKINLPSSLVAIETDPAQLEPILMELLNNAYKYTPPGERIEITANATASQMQIRVMNSGVEIPKAEQAQIFQKFYRIPNSDPWKHGGTGLGLALVKQRVERLGGLIQVQSSNSQTEFKLAFPLHAAAMNSMPLDA
ncbi:MAG: GAF domain-containing protein [Thainema sp.]